MGLSPDMWRDDKKRKQWAFYPYIQVSTRTKSLVAVAMHQTSYVEMYRQWKTEP